MAALVSVGIVTTLVIREPVHGDNARSAVDEARVVGWLERRAHWPQSMRDLGAWFVGAVVCPLVDFFARYGFRLGLLIFAFVSSYRLTDFTMGVMANPFYLDVGYSLKEIAAIAKGYGVVMSIVGTLLGGIAVARLGTIRALALGSVLVIMTNLAFMTLAFAATPSLAGLAIVISADNLAMGIAGTALIAYLSSLTSARYTATQYALFSSLYALPGKLLMGTSGFVVDAIGYPLFFVYTSVLGLPALVMIWFLARSGSFRHRTR
jgi:PAT family beta-lactamase induction signal transducer AmpG